MRSLRWRMAVWFGVSSALLLFVHIGITYRHLEEELRQEHWQRDYPNHPDWNIHGSYSEAEVAEIMRELIEVSLAYGIPLTLLAIIAGFFLSNKSLRPIAHLNEQLQTIRAPDLSFRINVPEADAEFRGLVRHINELLGRVEHAYTGMSEYAAKVAHELRTPLAILRLKVEQAGDRIPPELAEQLQSELHQLNHIVDQSLLIAKVEQGRVQLQIRTFDLAQLVADIAEDFALLAQENNRVVRLTALAAAPVQADPKHVRQILHNLFTNALKHGQGNIYVRLTRQRNTFVLLIANGLRVRSSSQAQTLGLGLRVVDTLLGLQPDLKCRRRRGSRDYLVRLRFPAGDPEVVPEAEPYARHLVSDPGL